MMKRTILHIATAVMLLAIFTACEKEALQAAFEGNNGKSIRILLNAQGDDVTRAVSRSDGNNAYGENTIATADVFFYDNSGSLIYDVAKENVTLSEPDANGVVTATVPMPSSDENIDLTQATKVYVMGNRQATDAQVASAKTSEAGLRALTFTTTSLDQVPTAETTFSMDGTGEITVAGNEISGTVELVRAAAKITLEVNLPSTLTADGKTYKPQTTGITVTFNKGVKTFGDETDMFNVEQRVRIAADAEGNTPVSFEPFYSYPTTWETGDDNEPYFTLHVPWGETNSEGAVTSYTTYHYRVPINKTHFENDGKTLALNRNHWYQVSVNVGVLGTPEASDEVDLTADYEVKPWGNLPIGANLLDYVYLIVDEEQVTMSNVDEISVGYQASHDIDAKIIYISRPTFTDQNSIGEQVFYNNSTGSTTVSSNSLLKECTVSIDESTNDIILSHELVNTMPSSGTNFDYSVYTIKVLVTMTVGNKTYSETITYKQYPERYIEGNISEGYVIVNGNKSSSNSWNVVQSGQGSNPINYIVNVTALEEDSPYVIGDPRTAEYSYLNYTSATSNGWTTAPAIYDGGTDRKMLYYYPTRYEGEGVENIIAPKFRVASSYGRKGGITAWNQVNARYRCASYQEDGFPAGRWRVPTAAEILYVSQLCNRGILGSIFDGGQGYWSATQVYNNGSLNNNETASVRCVYDEWYWGSEQLNDKSIFTWGDAPKQ